MDAQLTPPAIVISAEQCPARVLRAPGDFRSGLGIPTDPAVEAVVDGLSNKHAARLDEFIAGANRRLGSSACGRFVSGATCAFETSAPQDAVQVISQALFLEHESLLMASDVKRIQDANRTLRPEISGALEPLLIALSRGQKTFPAIRLPPGRIEVPGAEALRYEAMAAEGVAEILERICQSPSVPVEKRDELKGSVATFKKLAVVWEMHALSIELERDDASLLVHAAKGSFEHSVQTLDQKPKRLRELREAAETLSFPMDSNAAVPKLLAKARATHAKASLAAAYAAGNWKEAQGDALGAVHTFATMLEIGAAAGPEAPDGWRQARVNLMTRARELVPTALLELPEKPCTPEFERAARQIIGRFFQGPESEVVLGRTYERIIQTNLSRHFEDPKRFDTGLSDRAAERQEEIYREVFQALKLKGGIPADLSVEHLRLANETVDALLGSSLDRKNDPARGELIAVKNGLIEREPDLKLRNDLKRDLFIILARPVFVHPERFAEGDPVRKALEIETAAAHDLRAKILTRTEGLIAEVSPQDRQAKQRMRVALGRMFVHGMIETKNESEKLSYYGRFDTLNKRIRAEEEARIGNLNREIAKLQTASRDPTTTATLTVLQAEKAALELSITDTVVNQAQAALAAEHPQLTHAARQLINSLSSLDGNPCVRRLLERFRSEHESSALWAATKQCLAEVNRDFPLATLGLMIGAGLGGAYVASRWRKGAGACGFMLASCAVLGSAKLYYGGQGAAQVSAAFETGLSTHSGGQTILNSIYFGTDVEQTVPIFGAAAALWALRKRRREEGALPIIPQDDEGPMVRYGKDLLRLALSQIDPRRINFWLIAVPCIYGGYTISQSTMPPDDKSDAFWKFGYEVSAVLATALIYEGIHLRLRRGNESIEKASPDETSKAT